MKPLLMVVALHPKRPCRAREWLETEEVKAVADVKYLEPLPLGPPVYGSGGQLYTCANICKAISEAVLPAWRNAKDYKFFGYCNDDVVIETPGFLDAAMRILRDTEYEATGTPAKEIPYVIYEGRRMNCLVRCWVAVRTCLLDVDWDILWKAYELPDWEEMWMHYSKIKTYVFPALKWNHLVPLSGDCSDLSKGSVVEHYEGTRTWREKP